MVDQDGLLSNHLDFLPGNHDILVMPQQPHAFGSSMHDDGDELSRAGVYLHVVHSADAGPVADVDDLFIMHVRDSAKHLHASFIRSFLSNLCPDPLG